MGRRGNTDRPSRSSQGDRLVRAGEFVKLPARQLYAAAGGFSTVPDLAAGVFRPLGLFRHRFGYLLVVWNLLVAASMALATCLLLLGRAMPTQATRGWLLLYGLAFALSLLWLAAFSARLASRRQEGLHRLVRPLVLVEGPLLLLSLAGSTAIYASDEVNHQITYFLQPTPTIFWLLAILGTVVAQEASVCGAPLPRAALQISLQRSRRWALPTSLLLLGLLQGSSYLWVIGNDFTRYWAVADAMASLSGYPASIHQPSYIAAGMSRYSIELPLFPLLLLFSFTLVGHDTLGAHLPGLLANAALPLLLYAFYRKAGLGSPVAFAGAALVAVFPFFRLYTLNAPVHDAVFVALLVATGYAYLHLVGDAETRRRGDSPLPWLAFGLLAGLAALTRAEGLLFVAVLFLGLAPHLLNNRRFYLAPAAFLALLTPFSLLMISTFGIPWPRNFGSSFGLHHVAENLNWLRWFSLRWYAEGLGLSTSAFLAFTGLLAMALLLGTLWMARERWQVALLPAVAGLHVALVFTIAPRVAGADQWFDFFRHISYGIPFATLALLFLAVRAARGLGSRLSGLPRWNAVALLALLLCLYQLFLLARPSQTYGSGGTQLLTSDVWVTFPDIVANRYQLPRLPFVHREGVLMIDREFGYIRRHLVSVKSFFEPLSTISTGKGAQYQFSSMLVLLFGFAFALAEGRAQLVSQRRTSTATSPGSGHR